MPTKKLSREQRRRTGLLIVWVGIFLNGCSGGSHSQNPKTALLQAPVIVKQPTDQTAYIGDAASLAVTATGTAPLIYDWRRNGASLIGANTATYTTPALTSVEDGATYTVVVSNAAGSVLSSAAQLSVSPRPLHITAAPQNISDEEGEDAPFLLPAAGMASIAYPWLLNEDAYTWATVSGYTVAGANLADNGKISAGMAFKAAIGTFVGSNPAAGMEVTATPLKLQPADYSLKLTVHPPVTAVSRPSLYRTLIPEAGVGAVFGYINRPQYGAGFDANGRTVVALTGTDYVSINPTILASFVCHCGLGGIAPMLQIGASSSKGLPALLLGGGFRLFGLGKGDVSIGGGLLLGWYKDLQKLKVGSAVSETAKINADLGYVSTPRTAPYITLQYKF